MASNIAFSSEEHNRLPTTVASRERMLPDLPAAKKYLERVGADDLAEAIFGEDA